MQSRGRSVAELQVGGVQASYSGSPADSSVCLAVHSLLLVDAMQTLGSDYELLIASHKHLYMDSMSGSLMESEPTSPVSPSSPDPCAQQKVSRATSPLTLTQVSSFSIPHITPISILLLLLLLLLLLSSFYFYYYYYHYHYYYYCYCRYQVNHFHCYCIKTSIHFV